MASGPLRARRLALALLAAGAIALAGCGEDSEQSDQAPPVSEVERPAVENNIGPQAYRETIDESLDLLVAYWREKLAAVDAPTAPPARLVSFWNAAQDPGCGGEKLGPANAQYCGASDSISWDGRWIYGTLYRLGGEAAVAFLLAHEYGHLVQRRLEEDVEFETTIEAELNADCLAGAWLGAVDEEIATLTVEDYRALYGAVLDVADAPGVPWFDPTAHGNADQRGAALLFGGKNGPRACFHRYGPGASLR
jgi:predicted metalloprotease